MKTHLRIIFAIAIGLAAGATACQPAAPATPSGLAGPAGSAGAPTAEAFSPTRETAPASGSIHQFFEESFRALTLRTHETVLGFGLSNVYPLDGVALNDISDDYQSETYRLTADTLAALEQFDRAALSAEEQISYDIYRWYLVDTLAGESYRYHDYPATYFSVTAVQEDLIFFFTDLHPLASLQDVQDYVTRLGLVERKIDQLIAGLEIRQQAGITPPQFAIQWEVYGALSQFIATDARSNPLYTRLKEQLALLPQAAPEEKAAVLEAAAQAIEESALPAYRKLYDYLSVMPTYTGEDSGVWRLPDGEAYYQYLLRHYTTTDLSAEAIHQLGLDELARIHGEMRLVFDQLGYPAGETLAQSFDRVAADGGHVSGDAVLAAYEALIAAADERLDAAFDIRPQAQVIVIADSTGGYYVPASYDGSRPGAFYAGVGGAGEDSYAMPTLAYHEAIPGHHFQIALAQEMRHLPAFRQGLNFTAYTEGWALYAEQLADELGWYAQDPYGRLGMLQAQAFRAARLVVDTGLHAQGWTFAQAERFFTENTGLEEGDSINPRYQIARYLVWPGQATAYYVGYLKILELRQQAREQLGERFDLKAFHRVVLANGSMPLEVLENVVARYIAEQSAP